MVHINVYRYPYVIHTVCGRILKAREENIRNYVHNMGQNHSSHTVCMCNCSPDEGDGGTGDGVHTLVAAGSGLPAVNMQSTIIIYTGNVNDQHLLLHCWS